jgi:hypothetical protein
VPQTEIWTDLDERLRTAYQIEQNEPIDGNRFPYSDLKLTTRNLIITTITRLRSSRLQLPLPLPPNALRVYDNGEAQLYHLRPESPYQR